MSSRVRKENIKQESKKIPDEFYYTQEKIQQMIKRTSQNFQIFERENKPFEMENERRKFKDLIDKYFLRFKDYIEEDQIKGIKLLIESFENKQSLLKFKSNIEMKKKLIQEKMADKYLKRRYTNCNSDDEMEANENKTNKFRSPKEMMEKVLLTSSNIIKYHEKQIEQENDPKFLISKLNSSNSNFNPNNNASHLNINDSHNTYNNNNLNYNIVNNYMNFNNLNNNPNPSNNCNGKMLSRLPNNCDFNFTSRVPSTSFTNSINLKSFIVLEKDQFNQLLLESINHKHFTNDPNFLIHKEFIDKIIDNIKKIKVKGGKILPYLRDDKNYNKKLEGDIAILRDEFLKEYHVYKKYKELEMKAIKAANAYHN